MNTRYAFQYVSPTGDISYHMIGLPNLKPGDDGFGFAMLYATKQHALKACSGSSRLRMQMNYMTKNGYKIYLIEVQSVIASSQEMVPA